MVLYHYTTDYQKYDAIGEGFLGFAEESQVISIESSGKINLQNEPYFHSPKKGEI